MNLSSKAIRKLKQIVDLEPSVPLKIRLLVTAGGCSGFQYEVMAETQPNANDRVFLFDGLIILVDPKSYLYLKNISLKVEEGPLGPELKFENPDAVRSCGCGKSFF